MNSAVARLYVLDFGLFQVHANGRVIGIPGFLIQLHSGENMLVDTGFPVWYAADPTKAALADGLGSFGQILQLTHEQLPAAQLHKAGLTPAAITHLLLTHSDIDHIGGIGDFPQATIILGAAERALPQPRYFGPRSPIAWPAGVHYHLVDTDTELWPGVIALSTPGHAPGHLSLLVQLPQTGAVLLTGDAISRPAELHEGFAGAWDETQARQSAERLMALAEQERALIIYGHDPAQWPQLRKAPLFYE